MNIRRVIAENESLKAQLEVSRITIRGLREKGDRYNALATLITVWRKDCKCGAQKKLSARRAYQDLLSSTSTLSEREESTSMFGKPGVSLWDMPLRKPVVKRNRDVRKRPPSADAVPKDLS